MYSSRERGVTKLIIFDIISISLSNTSRRASYGASRNRTRNYSSRDTVRSASGINDVRSETSVRHQWRQKRNFRPRARTFLTVHWRTSPHHQVGNQSHWSIESTSQSHQNSIIHAQYWTPKLLDFLENFSINHSSWCDLFICILVEPCWIGTQGVCRSVLTWYICIKNTSVKKIKNRNFQLLVLSSQISLHHITSYLISSSRITVDHNTVPDPGTVIR